jgi:hypothetical protein
MRESMSLSWKNIGAHLQQLFRNLLSDARSGGGDGEELFQEATEILSAFVGGVLLGE